MTGSLLAVIRTRVGYNLGSVKQEEPLLLSNCNFAELHTETRAGSFWLLRKSEGLSKLIGVFFLSTTPLLI